MDQPTQEEIMANDPSEKSLDQLVRENEQYAFDFPPVPQSQPEPPDYIKPCNKLGYCYCPKCNPR